MILTTYVCSSSRKELFVEATYLLRTHSTHNSYCREVKLIFLLILHIATLKHLENFSIMSRKNRGTFTSSFVIFFSVIFLSRYYTTIINRRVRMFWFLPKGISLREKLFYLSSWHMVLIMAFQRLRMFNTIPGFWSIFIMKGC